VRTRLLDKVVRVSVRG